MTRESCAACRFWHREPDARHFSDVPGRCRRYAPQGPTESGKPYSLFPPMTAHQWCGDFRPTNDPDANRSRRAA